MKEPKRRRSLSGAVLVMILTVMFVLIILLTATLTTVTTANQRIYTKFEENQAYYTARSALDVFTQNMLADANYIAQDSGNRQYKHGDSETADMKQGLGIQLDLYSITAQSGYNIKQSDLTAYGNVVHNNAAIPSEEKKDEYIYYFGVEPSGTAINDMTYEVIFPTVSNGSNAYGKLSDSSKATIKVEVLDRKYNIGTYTDGAGSSVTVPEADIADFFAKTGSYNTVSDAMIAEAVANGNRKKDTMRVQITATTEYDGVEGIAVLLLDSNEPPVNNSSRAITAFGTAKNTNHAYIVGGLSMGEDPTNPGADVAWRNGGAVYGTVYNEAGINFSASGSQIFLTESEYLIVGGDYVSSQDAQIEANVSNLGKDERPFIYITKQLKVTNSFTKVGGTSNNQKIDIVTHGIDYTGNNFTVNGDVYSDGSCSFVSSAGVPDIKGDLYVKGNLTVGGNVGHFDTNDGKVHIKFGTTTNVYVSGNIVCDSINYGVTDVVMDQGTINTFSNPTTQMVLPTDNDIKSKKPDGTFNTTGDLEIEVKLPNAVKKKIESHKKNYDDYYAIDADGNYVDTDSDGKIPDPKTAEEMAGGVNFTDSSFTAGVPSLSTSQTTIDTTSDPVKWVITGANHTGHKYGNMGSPLRITGGGTVELILKNGFGNTFAGCIVADDDTTVKIYGGEQSYTYGLDNFTVWTQTTYDAYRNGTLLNVGSQSGHGIKVPKIYYYFSNGSTIELKNGQNFLTGYFFAPYSLINPSAGSNMTFTNLKYNGATVPSGWKYTVLGSVLCKDFDFQNDHGIIYINPNLDDDTPGDPIHQWQSYQYIRG